MHWPLVKRYSQPMICMCDISLFIQPFSINAVELINFIVVILQIEGQQGHWCGKLSLPQRWLMANETSEIITFSNTVRMHSIFI